MCLSTVYANEINEQNAIMSNVMNVECLDGKVILTDLMERKTTVDGTLKVANLVDGYVIISVA